MATVWCSIPLLVAQTPAIIRVPVRLVTAPTLVFSKDGRLVPGLESTNFRVYDNGARQKISLDTAATPVSVALVIQANQDVREYIPFIARIGSVVESLLLGESGEGAVIACGDEVAVLKTFDSGDVAGALRNLTASGRETRTIDAGLRAAALLKERPASRARVLLFIGQAVDSGSESSLDALRQEVERNNITVFALVLPELGKAFVSDTFSLEGLSSRTDRGGYKAGVDLGKLIRVLGRSGKAEAAADPFSALTAATGGTQFHFRKQKELEDAIATIGVELRSSYLLSYSPNSTEPGYHTIKVEVTVPAAKVYCRPGYWLGVE
jgi:VWFA-related protein